CQSCLRAHWMALLKLLDFADFPSVEPSASSLGEADIACWVPGNNLIFHGPIEHRPDELHTLVPRFRQASLAVSENLYRLRDEPPQRAVTERFLGAWENRLLAGQLKHPAADPLFSRIKFREPSGFEILRAEPTIRSGLRPVDRAPSRRKLAGLAVLKQGVVDLKEGLARRHDWHLRCCRQPRKARPSDGPPRPVRHLRISSPPALPTCSQ